MRVAHVHDVKTEAANGVYKTVLGLVTHLPNEGVEVEAWNITPDVKSIGQRNVNGTPVYDLPAHKRAWGAIAGLPAVTRAFVRERQASVDLVHFHSVFIPNNIWAAKDVTKPYIVTPNGGYGRPVLEGKNRFGKKAWLAWQERSFLSRARLVHAVSESECDELKQRWPDLRMRYVANAVDLPANVAPTPQPASKDFVFMGRLAIDHKGLDRMIRGFAKFVRDGRAAAVGYRLVLIGPDFRGSVAELTRLAHDEVVADRVVFTGSLFGKPKDDLIAGARAFVHTSRWEGMPFSVLEALSIGVPVLVTPQTNVGNAVKQYNAGVEVQPDDESIATGFARLANLDETAYNAMRTAARNMVAEQFVWPVVTKQLAAVYADVVGGERKIA